MRRAPAIGLALSLFACSLPTSAHDPVILDSRRATPGPRLELVEVPPEVGAAGKQYHLRVGPGLDRAVSYGVYTKPFDHSFHEVETGFRLDDSGNLVAAKAGESGRRRRLDEMVFGPGPYPPGAVWEIALVSADRAVRVFARTIPFPITASSGPCRASLELASHLGDRFWASGSGFLPGEDVTTQQRYSGRQIQRQRRVSPDGTLAPELLTHRAVGADRGARYAIRGRSCQVSVDYDWGEPALIRR